MFGRCMLSLRGVFQISHNCPAYLFVNIYIYIYIYIYTERERERERERVSRILGWRALTHLQRCSWCILQPQPTRPKLFTEFRNWLIQVQEHIQRTEIHDYWSCFAFKPAIWNYKTGDYNYMNCACVMRSLAMKKKRLPRFSSSQFWCQNSWNINFVLS